MVDASEDPKQCEEAPADYRVESAAPPHSPRRLLVAVAAAAAGLGVASIACVAAFVPPGGFTFGGGRIDLVDTMADDSLVDAPYSDAFPDDGFPPAPADYGDNLGGFASDPAGYVDNIGGGSPPALSSQDDGFPQAPTGYGTDPIYDPPAWNSPSAIDERDISHVHVQTGKCFPGEAELHVRGGGLVPMDALRVGDEVLVDSHGRLVFEPVLGFLHRTPCEDIGGGCPYVVTRHAHGELRASDHHLVFTHGPAAIAVPAAYLRPGDKVLAIASADAGTMYSEVTALKRAATRRGMFAPLTASGTLVVDGVVVSVYAGAPGLRRVPHGSAHAAFFFLRAYYKLGVAPRLKSMSSIASHLAPLGIKAAARDASTGRPERHPFVNILFDWLRLEKVFRAP